MVRALALTPSGAVAAQVECLLLSGRGRLIVTGNLVGEAKDSAQVALSLARSRARRLGIDPADFLRTDVHFHVVESLPAKGGPSAGLALFAALVSAMIRKPVDPGTAFTGEISLSGRIHPVGGMAEKIGAARQAGITRIYASGENIPEAIEKDQKQTEIVPVRTIDGFLKALFPKP
jgi:ATP-dependent Lon protease